MRQAGPGVGGGAGAQGVAVGVLDELHLEGRPALEGRLLQDALAEAVDGEHARLVDAVEGGQQPPLRLGPVEQGAERVDEREVARQGGCLWDGLVTRNREGYAQGAADARPQFFRGRLRECDHEQSAQVGEPTGRGSQPVALQHQAEHQPGDGERLAGPRAGLDQRPTGFDGGRPVLERRDVRTRPAGCGGGHVRRRIEAVPLRVCRRCGERRLVTEERGLTHVGTPSRL